MLRPIFVIGNSTHGLSRGMGFVKALSLHNLRIKTKNVISDIDPNRSHWNLIWSPLEQNWQQSSANKANLQYQYLLNHIQTTLVPFREQVKNHNHYLKTHHRSAQIQTWRQHCARKQIAGEWILSKLRNCQIGKWIKYLEYFITFYKKQSGFCISEIH